MCCALGHGVGDSANAFTDGAGSWTAETCAYGYWSKDHVGICHDGTEFIACNSQSTYFGYGDEVGSPGGIVPLVFRSTDGQTWTVGAKLDTTYGTDIMFSSDTNYYIAAAQPRDGKYHSAEVWGKEWQMVLLMASDLDVTTSFDPFANISDVYRSSSFSVLDGYVIMVGMLEHDTGVWYYYPRKVRWTVPGTYSNFTDYGSGAATFPGNGILLDCRTVNHRMVIFESNQISVLSPTGYVSSPFAYEVIADNLYTISNPVVVDKFLYFVANNGLLYKSDGVAVTPLGNAFDISKFDDFAEDGPVWLDYSGSTKCLMVFNKAQLPPYYMFMISLATGSVSRVELPVYAEDQTDADDNELPDAAPGGVFAVRGATDTRVCVGYGVTGYDDQHLHMAYLDVGYGGAGADDINDIDITSSWNGVLETGEFRLTPDGQKVHLHEVIVHSFCVPGYENPDVAVMVKSTGDSDWRYPCQPAGSITVTDSYCTGVGTTWASSGSTTGGIVAYGDDVETTFTLPWNADLARIYLYVEDDDAYYVQTEYTTSGKTVIFDNPPDSDSTVFAFCENEPSAVYPVGDYIYTDTAGYHRITEAMTLTSVTLDRYLSTGSDTGYFLRAKQLPEGPGETILGIDEELDGVQIRVLMIPRDGGPPEARFTGITVVYTPAGPEMRGD